MFFTPPDKQDEIAASMDQFNDSYARDTSVDELDDVCANRVREGSH